jgi:hypothetical protein
MSHSGMMNKRSYIPLPQSYRIWMGMNKKNEHIKNNKVAAQPIHAPVASVAPIAPVASVAPVVSGQRQYPQQPPLTGGRRTHRNRKRNRKRTHRKRNHK